MREGSPPPTCHMSKAQSGFKHYSKVMILAKFVDLIFGIKFHYLGDFLFESLPVPIWVRFLRTGIGPELCDFFKQFEWLL